MAEIIVITSGKGGVGKTIITPMLGVALSTLNKKTLLIDGDFGLRDLDLVLGVENDVLYDSSDVWKERCTIKEAVLSIRKNLDFLPASQKNRWEDVKRKKLKKVIKQVEDIYDYILIDAPAGIGVGVETILEMANRVLLLVEPTWTSIRDTQRLMKLCHDRRFFAYALIINSVPVPNDKSAIEVDTILQHLQVENVGAILPESEHIYRAANEGKLGDEMALAPIWSMLNPLVSYVISEQAWDIEDILSAFEAIKDKSIEGVENPCNNKAGEALEKEYCYDNSFEEAGKNRLFSKLQSRQRQALWRFRRR